MGRPAAVVPLQIGAAAQSPERQRRRKLRDMSDHNLLYIIALCATLGVGLLLRIYYQLEEIRKRRP